MSAELDRPTVSNILVPSEVGWSDNSARNKATRAAVLANTNGGNPVLKFLEEVVRSRPLRRAQVQRFRDQGRFLFGAHVSHAPGIDDQPYDGLLYAEATGRSGQTTFEVVKTAVWTAEGAPRDSGGAKDLGITMLRAVLRGPSNPVLTSKFGIPVTRDTALGDLLQPETPAISYGQFADVEAVRALPMPESERQLLEGIVTLWHGNDWAF